MNDTIRRRVDELDAAAASYRLLCECALAECQEMLDISAGEYDRVRSEEDCFAIHADHVAEEGEVVVERSVEWCMVREVSPC